MAKAVVVRRDGDTFQARIFWLKAARLLDPESPISRVGFEAGPKGFDDLWVGYLPKHHLIDQEGEPLFREHIQCKWHVRPGEYGHADLVDPEFINANNISLLQRALAGQRSHAPNGKGARFQLVTNWRISPNDPLKKLINNRSHTLRLDQLFDKTAANGAMSRVRKLWCEHLKIDDDALRILARTLSFSETMESLEGLRERLDPLLRIGGLRRISAEESAFIYDEIIFQWVAQGRNYFERETFRALCEREGLIAGQGAISPRVYGIKSFEHPIDRLEDRCASVLNLIPNFNVRQIKPESDWAITIYPALKEFMISAAKATENMRIVLDTHLTLSFAAGTAINIKSGRKVEIEQRTIGKEVWAPDDAEPNPSWSGWSFDSELIGNGADLAVAIGITHDITAKVRSYIKHTLPEVGNFLIASLSTGPSANAVKCGRHAFELSETLITKIRSECERISGGQFVHLFPACPGAFTFFLGQRHIAIGKLILYEFDFEGEHGNSYRPSLTIPPHNTGKV